MPTATPTPLPTSTPAPTPTPTPTPTPQFLRYSKSVGSFSYALEEIPPDLKSRGNTPTNAFFANDSRTWGLDIYVRQLPAPSNVDLLNDRIGALDDLAKKANSGEPDLFVQSYKGSPGQEITRNFSSAQRLEYRWHVGSAVCPRNVVEIIGLSNHGTHAVILSAWICQDNPDETTQSQRERMLNSYREK